MGKRKSKALIIVLLLSTPIFVNAIDSNVTINFDNVIKLYDKMQVTINIGGDTTTSTIGYGTKVEQPNIVNKDGYEFDGWYLDDTEYDFDSDVTSDIEIEARYNLIPYTITYILNGGTAENVEEYNVETDSFDLVNPTKQGFNFSGWTGSNGDALQTRVTIEKGSTGDKTYVANFSARDDTPYKVIHKYKNLDGTFDTEEEELTGVTETTVRPQTRYRYGFTEPELSDLFIKATGDSKLEYVYERVNYNLTYNNLNYIETDYTNESYPYGTSITVKIKDKPGYNFNYWIIGGGYYWGDEYTFTLNSDTLVDPKFTAKQYNIIFKGNNEEVDRDDYNQWATYDTDFTLYYTWFITQHYTFAGWNTEADGSGQGYANQEEVRNLTTEDSITLYAQWTPNTYTIEFNAGEGSSVDSVDKQYNQVIGVPNSTREGYDLEGWYTCPNGYCDKLESDTVATDDTIYYANWKIKKLHVDFDTMGGSDLEDCEPEGYDIDYNTQIYSLPFRTFKEGYVLEGWYKDTNYTEKVTDDYIVRENLHLYARWIDNVTRATIPSTLEILSGESGTISVVYDDIGEDYTFVGFDTSVATIDENGVVNSVSVGSTTFFVRGSQSNEWIPVNVTILPRVFTITFVSQGGEEVEPVQRYEDQTSLNLPESTKEYYDFGGWYTDTSYETRVGYSYPLKSDITVYAKWDENECTHFGVDSWDTIYSNITNGNVDMYPVGCSKKISMGTDNDNNSFSNPAVRVMNNTRPEICETEGFSQTACGFVLEFNEVITTRKLSSNGSTNTQGGWSTSEIRRYMNDDVYNALPSDLKNYVIDTYVVSGKGSLDTNVFETTDKMYAFNVAEIFGTNEEQPFNAAECSSESVESFNRTRKIDYYKDVNFINREYKAIRYYEPEGKSVNYFTRNPKPSSDILWTGSSWIGGIATINVDTEGGIVPVFRIWDGKSS